MLKSDRMIDGWEVVVHHPVVTLKSSQWDVVVLPQT